MRRVIIGGLGHYDMAIRLQGQINERGLQNEITLVVYDSIPNSVTEGGRVHKFGTQLISNAAIDRENFERIEMLNSVGIEFHLTMSNRYIGVGDLGSDRVQKYLRHCHNDMNGVIISRHDVNDCLRTEFPKFKRVYSVTGVYMDLEGKPYIDKEYYENLLKEYDYIVAPWELSKYDGYNKLKELSLPIDRIEFSVADGCRFGCKMKNKHYEFIDKVNYRGLTDRMTRHVAVNFCKAVHPEGGKGSRISVQEIEDMIVYGIRNFKIASRGRGDCYVVERSVLHFIGIVEKKVDTDKNV